MTWRSCSAIWYAVGDYSTDWNYYSKRAILASVYGSTLMYWLSDKGDDSGDYPETWAFLDRRIDNVLKTFGALERVKEPRFQPRDLNFQDPAPPKTLRRRKWLRAGDLGNAFRSS